MAPILSHPFRLTADGRVATVEQESEDGDAEQVAVLILTRSGERPLNPGFGITDPTFAGFEPTELAAAIDLYGPPVDLSDVTIEPTTADDVQRVEVRFA